MTKGCYTCRRRRVVCDNGLPTCRKCRAAGKECLGYQKPLVWVKGGVASRGKMMGLSFDDVMDSPKSQSHENQQDEAGLMSPLHNQEHGLEAASNDTSPPRISTCKIKFQIVGPDCQGALVNADDSLCTSDEYQQYTDGDNDGSLVQLPSKSSQLAYIPSLRAALVDPLFQDLDKLSRLYISHCKSISCGIISCYILCLILTIPLFFSQPTMREGSGALR